MPAQVIDLITSSPEPEPSRPNQAPPRHVLQSSQTASNIQTTKKTQEKTQVDEYGAVDFCSDDFDDTINLTGEPISFEQCNNKRLRLSSSPGGFRNRPSNRDRSHAFTNERNTTNFATIIDCTSSPEPDDRLIRSAQSPPRGRGRSPTLERDNGDVVQDSDPFASSPNLVHVEATKQSFARNHRDGNATRPSIPQDPGPSRSPQPVSTRPAHRELGLSSDPFASSPMAHQSTGKAKHTQPSRSPPRQAGKRRERREMELISSSAPTEPFPKSPNRRVSNGADKAVDVVEIESGSDGASDSDELPELANLKTNHTFKRARSPIRRSKSDIVSSRTRAKPSKSLEDKARDREARAAAKDAEKLQKRKDREGARVVKVREKERAAALAEANKMKTDKKVSAPEMIVDLPSNLDPTIKTQVETMLQELTVQYDSWDSPMDSVVKWRRKVRSKFNEELGYWEPTPLDIQDEMHVLVLLPADQFVDLVCNEGLESYMDTVESNFRRHDIVLLIEGMNPWFRTNRNIRNRQFTSGVRSQEPSASTAASRRRNNAPTREYIPEELIEDALLQLQVEYDILIHHTTIPLETAQWITIFTQHISTVPYKKQRDKATRGAGFCMESGQVRTGDDNHDTYVRMLQEIVRITAPIAYGVANEFGSVTKLVKGLEEGGQNRLEGVKKSANKDGVPSDRTVGTAVSKRLWKVFTGTDENSTEV